MPSCRVLCKGAVPGALPRFDKGWVPGGSSVAGLLLAASLLAAAPAPVQAQSIEELELRQAEEEAFEREEGTEALGLPLGFGLQAILENGTGINRDRPTSYTFLYLAPQLKLLGTLRFQANLGLIVNHLAREPNPWNLTDWALQLSDLSIWKERVSGINVSGYLRYSFSSSVESRNHDRYGVLRANLKLGRSIGPFYLSAELNGLRFFHRYTTSDPSRWIEEGNMVSNPEWGLNERVTIGYSPTSRLTLSVVWAMTQLSDYEGSGSELSGSLFARARSTDIWEHTFNCVLDMTYSLGDAVYLSGGYSILAPQIQNGGHDRSIDPFNPKYGQVYVDLVLLY